MSKIEMLKNVLALGKISQSKIGCIRWIRNAFSRKFQKPLLRRSLVDWVDYSNSCNPYPAQKKFMLKNCSVIFNYFQTALLIHLIHPIGENHEQC